MDTHKEKRMEEQKRPKPIVLWIVVSLLGLIGCIPAMFSPMLGDDPTQPRLATWAMIICVASFPIVCLASVGMSAAYAARRSYRACWWVMTLPLLNIVIGGLVIGWMSLSAPPRGTHIGTIGTYHYEIHGEPLLYIKAGAGTAEAKAGRNWFLIEGERLTVNDNDYGNALKAGDTIKVDLKGKVFVNGSAVAPLAPPKVVNPDGSGTK
jgi:hypothetical protein